MRLSRGSVRAGLALVFVSGGLVLAVAAQAHTCDPTAYAPVYNYNQTEVWAEGKIDCTGNQPADVLTVKLWRVISFYPDDNWGQNQDGYPPSLPGYVYHAVVSTCEASDPPDDFKTETVGNSNLHDVFASANSGGNLNC